ncbi:hypothetical protein Taro_018249 [Colocasia esculenta]|uniref:Uncharacterized protein n=1 Tax=Colocasia esculenta TaxID=4460 RepID=A0A843UYJ0_COLES|nr:hypothetical protein [Colocasia esculenta]
MRALFPENLRRDFRGCIGYIYIAHIQAEASGSMCVQMMQSYYISLQFATPTVRTSLRRAQSSRTQSKEVSLFPLPSSIFPFPSALFPSHLDPSPALERRPPWCSHLGASPALEPRSPPPSITGHLYRRQAFCGPGGRSTGGPPFAALSVPTVGIPASNLILSDRHSCRWISYSPSPSSPPPDPIVVFFLFLRSTY